MPGLRCCLGFSLVAAGSGCSRAVMYRVAAASLAAGHESRALRLQWFWLRSLEHWLTSGTRAQLLCSTWDIPRSGTEPASPALAVDSPPLSLQGSPASVFYALVFWPRGIWDFSSPTRDRTWTPCFGRQSLNHWTGREVPKKAAFCHQSCSHIKPK